MIVIVLAFKIVTTGKIYQPIELLEMLIGNSGAELQIGDC